MSTTSKSIPAIEVHSLRKTYREGLLFPRRVEALRGVSLTVEQGTIFGLLGPNGAGKTTLLKVLLGIVHKSGGSAKLLGYDSGNWRGRVSVGFLPEHHRIPRHHTANTALEYYGALSGLSMREIRQRRPELLKSVGLEKWGNTPVWEFSKGMQQRLGLAQAMIHDPDLLILDEPTDGVDPEGRSEIRVTLRRLKDAGKTIFINSHLLQEIELVCDRVAILVKGEVRREGLVETITQRTDEDYELSLLGEEPTIRTVLKEWKLSNWTSTSDGQYKAFVQLRSQQDVDRCVDGLRRAGISLVELVRHRDTLEEAFLDIIKKPVAESPFQKSGGPS